MRPTLSILLLSVTASFGQLWSGTIDPSRAIDWTDAGCGTLTYSIQYTSYTASATAAQIQTGLDNCPAGQYVGLQAGTYNLNNGLTVKSDTAIIGEGANATKLFFSSTTSCNFGGIGGAAFCIGNGNNVYGPNYPDANITAQNWVSNYVQFTNVIKLSSVSGLSAGMLIFLDQLDDTVDGYPASGDIVVGAATANNMSKQGGSAYRRDGRNMSQVSRVVSISGTNVTIDPAVISPAYRFAKTPQVWFSSAGTMPKTNVSVQNMSIDISGSGGQAILLFNAANCLFSGLRIVGTNAAATQFAYTRTVNALHCTFQHCYGYGPSPNTINQYGFVESFGTKNLYLNVICDKNGGQFEQNGNSMGTVWAYCFGTNTWVNIFVEHDAGSMFNLVEGCIGTGYSGDVIHGTGNFTTIHRNLFIGGASAGTGDSTFWISSYHRFYNFTGNVLGKNNTTYKNVSSQSGNEIFSFGENNASESGAGNPPTDTRVSTTAFLWGNWNNVSNTTLWLSAEVPSGITSFSNPVPAAQTVPNSYFFASKPYTWWKTIWGEPLYPPIGPGVPTGNVTGFTNANYTPGALAYRNLANDSFYGSLNVKEFNATNFFAGTPEGGGGGGSTVVNTSSLSGGTKGLSVSGNLSIR
jgi:hypothetical protein